MSSLRANNAQFLAGVSSISMRSHLQQEKHLVAAKMIVDAMHRVGQIVTGSGAYTGTGIFRQAFRSYRKCVAAALAIKP